MTRALGALPADPRLPGEVRWVSGVAGAPTWRHAGGTLLGGLSAVEGPAEVVLAWSGGGGEDRWAFAPRTWTGGAWDELESALVGAGRSVGRLLVRPHHAHVVGDIPTCLRLLKDRDPERVGLLLDPVSLLAPSMVESAGDHLTRIFEALGSMAAGVVLANLAPAPGGMPGEAQASPAPLHRGALDPHRLVSLAAAHLARACPVLVPDEAIEAQAALLAPLLARR